MKIVNRNIFETAEGYCRARIPGIVCTDKGTVIAYCELRRNNGDWSVTDIGMKKSSDGAKTWGERKIPVSGEGKNTVNNPLMIADGNILHFLYCVNYSRVFYMKSTDEGESWSPARELTEEIRAQTGEYSYTCIATGPTHGIRLSSGRLMVPVWMSCNKEDPFSHAPSVICIMYSDDKGESWRLGKICHSLRNASEFCVVQTEKAVIANIRHEGEKRCRAIAYINEDGSMGEPEYREDLPDPICCAGICSLEDEILFTNCEDASSRKKLVLKRLDGRGNILDSILISEEAGYSDVAVSPEKTNAYILCESEKNIICSTLHL